MKRHYSLDEIFFEQDSMDQEWMVIHKDPSTGDITSCAPVARKKDGSIDYDKSRDLLENSHLDILWRANYASNRNIHGNHAANLFVNKEIKRVDYLIGEDEGKALRAIVEERFPDYPIWSNPKNVIGSYSAYRAPYTSPESISVYDVCDELNSTWGLFQPMAHFGVDQIHTYNSLKPWYGWKFNLTDNSVIFKIVHIDQVKGVVYPPFIDGQKGTYYGRFHHEDGTISNDNDMFFSATNWNVEKYCKEYNLACPLPDEDEVGFVPYEHTLILGVGFDGTTGVPYVMKAYEGRDVSV